MRQDIVDTKTGLERYIATRGVRSQILIDVILTLVVTEGESNLRLETQAWIRRQDDPGTECRPVAKPEHEQIGRASCRERV